MTADQAVEACQEAGDADDFDWYDKHVRRDRKRDLTRHDVRVGLMRARSALFQPYNGRWKVVTSDSEGKNLTLIVEFKPDCVVVTAF